MFFLIWTQTDIAWKKDEDVMKLHHKKLVQNTQFPTKNKGILGNVVEASKNMVLGAILASIFEAFGGPEAAWGRLGPYLGGLQASPESQKRYTKQHQ